MSDIEGAPTQPVSEDTESQSRIQLAFEEYYSLAKWILPPGVGVFAFVALHGAVLTGVAWTRYEWLTYRS
jgi:hypothetical protein